MLFITVDTFVIERTFYLQKVEASKVTLSIYYSEYSMSILNKHEKKITMRFLFICVFRIYMFCV